MKRSARSLLGVISVVAFVAAACGDGEETTSSATTAPSSTAASSAERYVANAAEFVEAADWDAAKEQTIELSEFAFTPKEITLEAGQPYILKVVNTGDVKHEFTAGEFFRTVATRKAETAQSEVKVPFFTEVEVFAGETVEIYLVPLIAGTYDLVCEIEGHFEAGMFGTITVTGEAPASPAIELADVASGSWNQDGPALVEAADWDAAKEQTIELSEFAFTPKDFTLTSGQPYILKVVNTGDVKHEFTAEEFFGSVAFRKAEDASGEFKAPAPREIEVFAGKEIEVYLIPTETGAFDLVCEIEGHFEAGMFGTITVAPAS
ncbi:MAG TPA: cupredoxin domain-containing protein [Acidimicrobiia bacterium]|nr:cupredoxin domain-containing protein [Acidimicrobiia bacterium]